jgi:hypothetical protein
MSTNNTHIDLHHDCLDKLNRVLDLVLKSAETASAEGNHKVVIQAAREVTRIVTLITKMTDTGAKSKPKSIPGHLAASLDSGGRKSQAPRALENKKPPPPPAKAGPGPRVAQFNRQPGNRHPAGTIPNLKGLFRDSLFQPDELNDLDPLSLDILHAGMK